MAGGGSSAEDVECRDELISEVLSRVSTRDLLKICTVAKRWHSLIFDPGFAHTHHNNCRRESLFIISEEKGPWEFSEPLIRKSFNFVYLKPYKKFQFRSYNAQNSDLSIVPLSFEIPETVMDGMTGEIFASNGLVCFSTGSVLRLDFLLCNPVTKFVRKLALPFEFLDEGKDYPCIIGFCSTQKTKKMVIAGRCIEGGTYTLVFDSQSNLWYKGPPLFPSITEGFEFELLRNPLFFNGVIYFLIRISTIHTQEGEETRDVNAFFRDEKEWFYMIIGYDVNEDQWCFSVFIPASVGYPYCLIEWDGKLLVLASNSTHEDNLFAMAASSSNDRKRKITYSLNQGDGRFVFWILDTEHKLWTRERELDLSYEFHTLWRVCASGGVVWLTSGYNSVVVYHMKNGHCSRHRLDANPWRKKTYMCISLEPTLLSF